MAHAIVTAENAINSHYVLTYLGLMTVSLDSIHSIFDRIYLISFKCLR